MTAKQATAKIVKDVIADLSDRRGVGQELDRIDPDVRRSMLADLRAAVGPVVAAAIAAERERCKVIVVGAMSDCGTDDPHQAIRWAVEAIERGPT